MKLTQAFARRAKCDKEKSKQVFYDDTLKGFMLEVKANGRKTYYLRYTCKDKKAKYTKIGDATIIPAEVARTKALKLKRAIEEGKEVTIDTPEPQHQALTLQQFYDEYYLPHVKIHSNSWRRNESTYRLHILPYLGDYPMDTITSPTISKLHIEAVTLKHLSNGTVNKIIIFLRHAYNLALEMKVEGITDNPAKRVKQFEETHREMYITKTQTKRLMKAVEESKNPHLKYIIPFLLLSGARKSEVLRAKWRDIDYERNVWTIPITKNKKIRKIPISDQLLKLIKTIPNTSQYLFPAPIKKGHYTDVARPWYHARAKAGLHSLKLHDLRHSFASALVNSGRSLYEVQMLLGHSSMRMTQRYAHLNNESLMKAASCAGKLLN